MEKIFWQLAPDASRNALRSGLSGVIREQPFSKASNVSLSYKFYAEEG
jgi:hypothetical protein